MNNHVFISVTLKGGFFTSIVLDLTSILVRDTPRDDWEEHRE